MKKALWLMGKDAPKYASGTLTNTMGNIFFHATCPLRMKTIVPPVTTITLHTSAISRISWKGNVYKDNNAR
jgi:hypothetical protein